MESSGKKLHGSPEQSMSYHEHPAFEPIVHQCEVMKRICSMTFSYARMDMPVLITGETGTGKELIARAIHEVSNRADQPFVVVDCAALPETLLGNELFGHERGAYTGADKKQPGLFAAANKGTVFLDEIGELHLTAQAALLRVLQDGSYRPYGSVRLMSTDVRIIAATNRDLEEASVRRTFRLDLFHRIRSAVLQMPPLRSRTADIPLLVRHFMRKLAPPGGQPLEVSPMAMSRLLGHPWEGNVRELENRIRSAIALASNGRLTVEDIFPERAEPGDGNGGLPSLRSVRTSLSKDTEGQYLERILRKTNGNVSEAARIAGVHRTHLYNLMRQYEIDPADYRLAY
ncbi:MAG: sigma-54 dependent transcriptional regulator [Gemmatimonadetes bacterium]|nr:sigma-54 dependent transcriptional regulator [Gemmatimonadota bacterium]